MRESRAAGMRLTDWIIMRAQGENFMLKTDNPQFLLEAVIKELANGARGSLHCANQTGRSSADVQYFTGGYDVVSMAARRIAESGVVDREEFLIACGLTP